MIGRYFIVKNAKHFSEQMQKFQLKIFYCSYREILKRNNLFNYDVINHMFTTNQSMFNFIVSQKFKPISV